MEAASKAGSSILRAGHQGSQRLLSANTAQDALAAMVGEIVGSADFSLLLQMGRVPGADVEVAAVWDAETGLDRRAGESIPYASLAPLFEPKSPAPELLASAESPAQDGLETVVVTDVGRDERVTPEVRQLLAARRARSFVAVPIEFQGQTRALLVVGRRQAGRYSTRLVRQYERVAGQLAGVLHNVALLEQSQTRAAQLEVVAEISSAASSVLNLDELLPLAAELIRDRFGLYYVGIFLLDLDDQRVTPESTRVTPESTRVTPESTRVTLRAGTGAAGQQMVAAGHHFMVGEESMIGWCVANRQARIALDVGQEAVRFDNPLLPDTRSELALPLMARGKLVGAMTVQSTRQAAFDQGDVTVFLVMADQLANAIENARFFQERERRITQMGIVNEIGQALSMGIELDILFELVHAQVGRLFDAKSFYIAVYEEGRDFWELAFSVEGGVRQPPARHSVTAGLTGWIVRHRTPILLRSREENRAFHAQAGIPTIGPTACSWLGVPLVVSQKLVGAMGIQDYEQEYLYDESDRALFETIAAQVATLLDNTRLLEVTRERAQEMEVINQVGRVVTSVLDLDEVLRRLVDVTKEEFGYYFVSIALIREAGMEIKYGSRIGGTDRRLEVPELVLDLASERSLVAECAQTAQPVLVGDVLDDPRYLFLDDLPDTRSELTVPIMAKGPEGTRGVIGTLDVQSDKPFAFDETDIRLLQLLAGQAGTAIENAQLFAETRRRADELRVLHTVSLELAQEQRDLNTVLEALTRRTMDLLDSDGGGVWLWLDEESELELAITYQVGEVDFAGRRLKPGEGLTGLAFAHNEIQVIDDYLTWDGRSTAFADAPFLSAMAIPMTWQAETVGVLVSTRSQAGRPYRPEERELGELLAAQAASVIQNARLFAEGEARAEELAAVNEVGRAISSVLDLDAALQQIVDTIKERFGHFFVGILLLEGSGPERYLVFRSSSTVGDTGVRWQRGELRLALDGYGVTVAVVNSGIPILVNDVRQDSRYGTVEGLEPVQSELDTPIKVKGEVIGVLTVQSDRLNAFDEGDVSLLQGLASQAGVAIDNARLFEETEQRGAELEQRGAELQSLYETSLRMSAHMETTELLTVIVERAAELVGAETAGLYVYEPRSNDLVFSVGVGYLTEYLGRRLNPGEGLAGRVFVERRVTTVDDYHAWMGRAAAYEEEGRLGMLLAVPLVSGERSLGVLELGVARGGAAFQERDIRLAELFGAQAAIALENAFLFEEGQSRAEELAVLNEMGRALTARLDVDEALRSIAGYLSRLIDFGNFYVALYRPETEEVSFPLALDGGQEVTWASRRAGKGLTEYVLRTAEPLLIREKVAEYISSRLEGVEQVGQTAESWLGTPMVSGDQVVGVLAVQSYDTPNLYTEHDRDLLVAVASQTAIAVQNARLFEETERRAAELAVLNEMGQALTARLDVGEVMQNIYRFVSRLMDTANFYVALNHPETGEVSFPLWLGVEEGTHVARRHRRKGLTEQVIDTAEPLLFQDTRVGHVASQVEGVELIGQPAKSWLGAPMVIGEQVLGVLVVQSYDTPYLYGEHERDLLIAVASQAAIALQNARLFEQAEGRARYERMVREITTQVRASTDADTIMRTAVREVGSALDRPAFIRLGRAEPGNRESGLGSRDDARRYRVEGGE